MPHPMVGRENSAAIEPYYEDLGSGASVVLIQLFPLSSRRDKQTAALIGTDYRVITHDQRGFGRSIQPSSG
jgi:non-heme chloroperoxidase